MLQQNISNIQKNKFWLSNFYYYVVSVNSKLLKARWMVGQSIFWLTWLFRILRILVYSYIFFRVFLYLAKRPHFAYFKLSVSQFFDAHIVSYLKYLKKNNRIKRHCKKKSSYIIELISNSTSILAIGIINLDTYVCIYVKMYTEIYQIFRCELNCTLNNNYTAIILITI